MEIMSGQCGDNDEGAVHGLCLAVATLRTLVRYHHIRSVFMLRTLTKLHLKPIVAFMSSWLCMPFWLTNAPTTFQSVMNLISAAF